MKHFRRIFLSTLLLLWAFTFRAQSLFLPEDNLEELAEETGSYILSDKATFLTFQANRGVME